MDYSKVKNQTLKDVQIVVINQTEGSFPLNVPHDVDLLLIRATYDIVSTTDDSFNQIVVTSNDLDGVLMTSKLNIAVSNAGVTQYALYSGSLGDGVSRSFFFRSPRSFQGDMHYLVRDTQNSQDYNGGLILHFEFIEFKKD